MKDTGSIIKLAILAAVAYFGYEYLVRSGLWAQWFGGATLPASGGTTALPPVGTTLQLPAPPQAPAISAAVQSQLQTSANGYLAANPGKQMTTDLWLYYYQILVHGANPNNLATFPITGAQAATVFNALGINYNDPTQRVTPVTLPQFIAAMSHAGVSGLSAIIPVPNNGPISAPLPTQSFGAGYGGYGRGGYTKGNFTVQ